VLGNVNKHSSVRVTNAYRVSYPGYAEILTGRAQDDAIRGNDAVRNPATTVLEFLRRKLGLPSSQVALFGSWEILSSSASISPVPSSLTPGIASWNYRRQPSGCDG